MLITCRYSNSTFPTTALTPKNMESILKGDTACLATVSKTLYDQRLLEVMKENALLKKQLSVIEAHMENMCYSDNYNSLIKYAQRREEKDKSWLTQRFPRMMDFLSCAWIHTQHRAYGYLLGFLDMAWTLKELATPCKTEAELDRRSESFVKKITEQIPRGDMDGLQLVNGLGQLIADSDDEY